MNFRVLILLAAAVLVGCSEHPTQPTQSTTIAKSPVQYGPSVTISGTVTDTSNRPLADVNVNWVGAAEYWGDRGHGVMTDANGTYHLNVGGLPVPENDT
jgi:hypothetical protein